MTDIISEALDGQDTMPAPAVTTTLGTVQDGGADCDDRDDVTVTPEEGSGGKQSQATLLVKLARDRYRLISGDDGRPYAMLHDGPNIAQPLRSRSGLKGELARLYADEHRGAVPSATALSDAVTALEGYARGSAPEPVHVRVAPWQDGIVLDLGTVDGRCVVAGPGEWRIMDRSPVVFRRSALTLPIPDPVPGTLDDLEDLLNFSQDTFRLVTGYVLAALVPAIPHPILALFGEQGTAKSTAARLIGALVDPSPAPLRSAPRDVPQWAVTASGSWVVCLDNVSDIPPWLSDTLCKAVTGDGIVNRALYTDGAHIPAGDHAHLDRRGRAARRPGRPAAPGRMRADRRQQAAHRRGGQRRVRGMQAECPRGAAVQVPGGVAFREAGGDAEDG